MEGITTIVMATIIWYASDSILAGSLSIGITIGFIHTLDKIFDPIRDFTSQVAAIQRTMAAFEHIDELYQQATDEHDDTQTPLTEEEKQSLLNFNSLEFHHVFFRYTDSGPWILNDISFRLSKGHQLALVGATGSGKSTIIKLITRNYKHQQGDIRINGISIERIEKETVYRLFSLMQQDVFLFNESIAFNIALDKATTQPQTAIDAARYVYADTFIEQLPNKYQSVIENNGSNLSSGQAQLIAFARAIASHSDVVMLDEATAAVDSVTEGWIQKALTHIFAEKTVIAVAHRLSTIKKSDHILVLEQGKIIEQGNHQA